MNPWVILGMVVAFGLAATGGYYQGNQAGKATVQQAWDKEKAEQYAQYAKAMEESVEKQQQLQMGADRLRQEKDREIRDITARNTALANSLQQRQTRPAETNTVSSAASAGSSGCTGKELYREDSQFLVRLAAEADELRVALKQCYAQYDAARQTVK
jgi:hypothetical protein